MTELPLRERVANERRRLKSVRQALSAAVAQGAGGDVAYIPFYIAIAAYIEASMHRLHIQDVRMGDTIRAKLGTPSPEQTQALHELDERLAGNQRHLKIFLDAREALRTQGAAALGRFEKASADYTSYIVNSMGHHDPTTSLARDLLTQDDWVFMAGITDEETRREQTLYERVFATVPAGLKLPATA